MLWESHIKLTLLPDQELEQFWLLLISLTSCCPSIGLFFGLMCKAIDPSLLLCNELNIKLKHPYAVFHSWIFVTYFVNSCIPQLHISAAYLSCIPQLHTSVAYLNISFSKRKIRVTVALSDVENSMQCNESSV